MDNTTHLWMLRQLQAIERDPDAAARKFRLMKTFRKFFTDPDQPMHRLSATELASQIRAKLAAMAKESET